MGEGNVDNHKVGVTSYRSHPFLSMSIGLSIPDTAFSKIDLENPRSRSNDQLHV